MKDFFGIWVLDKPLYCKKEISGKYFHSRIANLNVIFHFPSCPDVYDTTGDLCDTDILIPPYNTKLFSKKLHWGKIQSWPESLFSVNTLLCSFKGEDSDIQKIYTDFPRWKQKFNNLVLIDFGNYIQPEQSPFNFLENGTIYDGISFIMQNSDKSKCEIIENNRKIDSIQLPLVSEKHCYSNDKMQSLFYNAGSSKELTLPYELLLAAYHAMIRHDFRSAVTLTGTALEQSILNKIQLYYDNNQLSSFENDKTMRCYRTLGGKFKWLNDLGITIPVHNYQTKILDIRNPTTHEGIQHNYNDTKQYLANCKTIISEYNPNVLEE